jgi:phospholipid/cholesterol/gamma-HCH transport system substrate-binding protein
VAAFSILSVLVFLLTGGTLFESKSALYLYIPDAAGLAAGAAVQVNGIDVGKVESVALSGSNQPDRIVKLTLQIETQYLASIPAGSYAQIETETALGDKYINITRGAGNAPTPPNATIPFRAQPELLKTLDLEQFTKQLRAVSALLDDIEQGKNPTGQLLLTDDLYNRARAELAAFERDIADLRKPGNPIGKWLYTDNDFRRIQERVLAFDRALAAIQSGQNSLGKLIASDTDYDQLIKSAGDLRRSIEKLGTAPFLQSEEMYSKANHQLESLIQTVDQINVNPLLTTSEMYDNLNGLATQLRDEVRDFRENPEKYLRIKMF